MYGHAATTATALLGPLLLLRTDRTHKYPRHPMKATNTRTKLSRLHFPLRDTVEHIKHASSSSVTCSNYQFQCRRPNLTSSPSTRVSPPRVLRAHLRQTTMLAAFVSSPLQRFSPPKRPRASLICSATPPASPSSPSPSSSSSTNPQLSRKVERFLLQSEQTTLDSLPSTPHPLPVNLDLLNYQARQYARSDPSSAERLYRKCISINSTDGRAWLGLAKLHQTAGNYHAARSSYRAALRACPPNAHLLQAWGVLEERNNNIRAAKSLFEAAIRANHRHVPSWVALGLWYQRRGQLNDARVAFRTGSQIDPSNYYVWHVWGVLEQAAGQVPLARKLFISGSKANPRNAATYVAWGRLEDSVGNYEMAISLFNKAHVANPRNAYAYVAHAVAAEKAGEVAKAKKLLRKAIGMRSRDAAPRQTLGMLEYRLGNFELAAKHFKHALRINKSHAPTYQAWATVELAQGNLEKARELFQEAVWAAPKSIYAAKAFHAWAMLEMEHRNFTDARRYLAHGLEIDTVNVPLLSGMAKLEAWLGNMTRAREFMERCVKLQPKMKSVWRTYQTLEEQHGSLERSRLVFERSLMAETLSEERVIVSPAMPGDYKAGGMWMDAMDAPQTEMPMRRERKKKSKRINNYRTSVARSNPFAEDPLAGSSALLPKPGLMSKPQPPLSFEGTNLSPNVL